MKRILIVVFLFLGQSSQEQSLIDSLLSPGFTYEDSIGIKLSELAMSNPSLELIDGQIKSNNYEVAALKGSWLNPLTASFNLNEFNIKGNNPDDPLSQNAFYPRYNFGLTLPIGMFFSKPAQIKSAKSNTEVLKRRREVESKRIRTATLEAYQRFQWNKYLLALQETILNDELILYRDSERKFKNKEIGLAPFTESARRFNNEVNRRITIMKDVNISKYELEGLIGMTYEDALEKISSRAPSK